jgi:hypothetical protein
VAEVVVAAVEVLPSAEVVAVESVEVPPSVEVVVE